jgi:arylsulfatase A-like enzyme
MVVGARRKVQRKRVALALVILLVTALFLGGCGPGNGESSPKASAGSDGDFKVFLIGVDGLTWRIVDPMLERGELPHIESLIRNGSRAEFITLKPALSPIVWTTIATGKLADQHGIRGFWRTRGEADDPGDGAEQEMIERLKAIGYIGEKDEQDTSSEKTLYRSTDWKARALWEILGDEGMESTVLGWWTTYPVQPIEGVMVSDRYLFNRFELEAEARGDSAGTSGRHVHPPELEPRFAKMAVPVEEIDSAWLDRFVDGPVEVDGEMTLHNPIDELRIVLARDASFHRMALDLLSEAPPDFFTVYYEGVDISSHYFWKYLFPDEWNAKYPDAPIDAEELDRFDGVITEHYRLMDEYIGDLLEHADDDTMIMVMSDHGFVTGRRNKESGLAYETVSGTHGNAAPPGVLVMSGFGVKRDQQLRRATVLDIAPTLLAAYGLPVARDMPGQVLFAGLDKQAFEHPVPASFTETYETKGRGQP